MKEKKRLDVWLVEQGHATTRTRARDMIEAGQVHRVVSHHRTEILKASSRVEDGDQIRVTSGVADRYVSRGGLKLEGALHHWNISVAGRSALDVGQSTGGFTDCLLREGARSVIGIDVGHDQLDARLRQDGRVIVFEGFHVRDAATDEELGRRLREQGVDLVVVDLAFMSLALALPFLTSIQNRPLELIALVKPQFELSARELTKSGLVRDPERYAEVRGKIETRLRELDWRILDWIDSPITGKDGNREFFVHARIDS